MTGELMTPFVVSISSENPDSPNTSPLLTVSSPANSSVSGSPNTSAPPVSLDTTSPDAVSPDTSFAAYSQAHDTMTRSVTVYCGCFTCAGCHWIDPEFYGSGVEACQRSLTLGLMAFILFSIGLLLTGLGSSDIIQGSPTATGPMCMGLSVILMAVAVRYCVVARRRRLIPIVRDEDSIISDEASEVGSSRDPTTDEIPPTYSTAVMGTFPILPEHSSPAASANNSPTAENGSGVVFSLEEESDNDNIDEQTILSLTCDNRAVDMETIRNQSYEIETSQNIQNPQTINDDQVTLPPSYTEIELMSHLNIPTDDSASNLSTITRYTDTPVVDT